MDIDEKILVVEFGSQYSHLIVRRIRGLGVYSELIYPEDIPYKMDESVKGIVLSGGPMSIYDHGSPKIDREILDSLDIPILGICYGHQLIAHLYGGKVEKGRYGEYGGVEFKILDIDPIVDGLPKTSRVWMSHKDFVTEPPPGFRNIGSTEYSRYAALANDERKIYTLQFHPEVSHTEYGDMILGNFIYKICGCRGGYDPYTLIEDFIKKYSRYSDENVLMAVSGGVDSTVTAFILREIFGDNLHLVYIDTGFTREKDRVFVARFFEDHGFSNIHILDRRELFLSNLMGIGEPEEKRRIFSHLYFQVLNEFTSQLEREYGRFRFLGQGTLYPDVVESGKASKYTDRIKSHHNVAYSELSRLERLEPLKYLYKDEVRRVAEKLGLPREVYLKHPFPGPGYLVRIVGEVNFEKLNIVKKADEIVEDVLRKHGIYYDIWQAFAAVLPVKTVGVKGDMRSYEYPVVVRIVESLDGMTAKHSRVPYEILDEISKRILDEVEGVNRVLYDLSDKPPSTIEYE